MNRHIKLTSSFISITLAAAPVSEADVGAYATVASDYVYRGLQITDANPALQVGIDYWRDSGWFVGAWVSTIDVNTRTGQRDLETDYYTGFHFQPSSSWSATVTLLRYTYPGASGIHAYDHNELLATVSWNDRWAMELAYTNELYGLDASGRHWELRGEQPYGSSWLITGALGGNDFSDLGTSHFLHWDFGVSYLVSRFSIDLRYYDNERPDRGLARALAANGQFVVSVTATF